MLRKVVGIVKHNLAIAPRITYTESMNIVLLGGNSKRHYQWVRDLAVSLTSNGHTVILHDYKHWSTGDESADIEYEIDSLSKQLEPYDNYIIIAKSVGTLIASLGIQRGSIKATHAILLGIPLDGVVSAYPEFTNALRSLPPTAIVQNSDDPYGAAADVKHLVTQNIPTQTVSVLEIPDNSTHDYVDFALLNRIVAQLGSTQ